MMHTPPAEYPFQQVVADMFQIEGSVYMVYADRLTGWLEVAHFPNGATSNKISNHLRSYFSRWGAPEQISTDGGTNLASEEREAFFRRWGVKVRLSLAQYPQSNGRAEANPRKHVKGWSPLSRTKRPWRYISISTRLSGRLTSRRLSLQRVASCAMGYRQPGDTC
ncbi:uncharacterized protein [Palaemon carinicauda]|uniref:uncharacterized protein n=1 Tax=Palaemon carinicauda TaxID=392227 RepID=UPI0035B6AA67